MPTISAIARIARRVDAYTQWAFTPPRDLTRATHSRMHLGKHAA